jgi:peptidoglycan hydrolase-like protein with peptidoglycan-binding domain
MQFNKRKTNASLYSTQSRRNRENSRQTIVRAKKMVAFSLGCAALTNMVDTGSAHSGELTISNQTEANKSEYSKLSNRWNTICNVNRFNRPFVEQLMAAKWSDSTASKYPATLASDPAISPNLSSAGVKAPDTLKLGDRGEAVRELQNRLSDLGLIIDADGIFGHETQNAVACFQTLKGLPEDGIYGPQTAQVLRASDSAFEATGVSSLRESGMGPTNAVDQADTQPVVLAIGAAISEVIDQPGQFVAESPEAPAPINGGASEEDASVFNTEPFIAVPDDTTETKESGDLSINSNPDDLSNGGSAEPAEAASDTDSEAGETIFNTDPFIGVIDNGPEAETANGIEQEPVQTTEPTVNKEEQVSTKVDAQPSITQAKDSPAVDPAEVLVNEMTADAEPEFDIDKRIENPDDEGVSATAEVQPDEVVAQPEDIVPEEENIDNTDNQVARVTAEAQPDVIVAQPEDIPSEEETISLDQDIAEVSSTPLGDQDNNIIVLLEELTAKAALPQLMAIIKEPSNEMELRQDAILALVQVGNGEAVSELTGLLDSNNEEIRSTAEIALGQMGNSALSELNQSLHGILQSSTLNADEKAASASKLSNVITSIQGLEGRPDNSASTPQLAPNVARLIEKLTGQEAFSQLAEVAKDANQHSVVRLAAIDQLSQLGCSPGCYFCNGQIERE